MRPFEEYQRNNLTVKIFDEDMPLNPREEFDNFGIMICSHRNYKLGDEQIDISGFSNWEEVKDHLYEERGAGIVLPLGLYDHSGITMYVGDKHDRWDGCQVGFIYVPQDQLEAEYGVIGCHEIEKATERIKAEVEEYDKYLRGDVYGFVIENPKTGEEIDSLWNIFGFSEAIEEANMCADSFIHPHDAAHAKKASALHA